MALNHNKKINRNLLKTVEDSYKSGMEHYHSFDNNFDKSMPEINEMIENEFIKRLWEDFYFYPESGFVSYIALPYEKHGAIKGFLTNIIQVTFKSSDKETQAIIEEINAVYKDFCNYKKGNYNRGMF